MCAVHNALDCDMINAIKIQKTSLVQNYSFVVTMVPQNLPIFAMSKFT